MAAGDIKRVYGSEAALTATLANLATSADLSVGRQSSVIDNTSDLVLDEFVAGKITAGTSPTNLKKIQVYAFGQVEDTPTYPGGAGASDAAWTPATPLASYLKLIATIATDATSDKAYWFGPIALAVFFGGVIPPRWGLWVTHNTAQNLKNAGGDQALWHQPIYNNVAS